MESVLMISFKSVNWFNQHFYGIGENMAKRISQISTNN